MALTIANTANFVETVSQASHSTTITLDGQRNRKIILMACNSATTTFSSPTFDGNAMTNILGITAGSLRTQAWYYDVPDSAASGTGKSVSVTTDVATDLLAMTAWQLSGALSGDPPRPWFNTAGNTVTQISASTNDLAQPLSFSYGSVLLAGVMNNAASGPVAFDWSSAPFSLVGRYTSTALSKQSSFTDAQNLLAKTAQAILVRFGTTNGSKIFYVLTVNPAPDPVAWTVR